MELHTKKTYAMNGVSVLIDTNIANLPSIITPFFTSLFFSLSIGKLYDQIIVQAKFFAEKMVIFLPIVYLCVNVQN